MGIKSEQEPQQNARDPQKVVDWIIAETDKRFPSSQPIPQDYDGVHEVIAVLLETKPGADTTGIPEYDKTGDLLGAYVLRPDIGPYSEGEHVVFIAEQKTPQEISKGFSHQSFRPYGNGEQEGGEKPKNRQPKSSRNKTKKERRLLKNKYLGRVTV